MTELRKHLASLERALGSSPTEDLPAVLAELERLKALSWIRLVGCSRPSGSHENKKDMNLSVKEAAIRLGVSTGWLYKNSHRLPFTVRIGCRVLFSATGLERWNKTRQGFTALVCPVSEGRRSSSGTSRTR